MFIMLSIIITIAKYEKENVYTCMYLCQWTFQIPYSEKFSYGANFRIFRMHDLHTKIKTMKI